MHKNKIARGKRSTAMEEDNIIVATVMYLVQHYTLQKYWKMRSIVIDPNNKTPKLL